LARSDLLIVTGRLVLTALSVGDADEMARLFDDVGLHEFIGGRPETADELRDRYARLVDGSGRPGEIWLNWIVRRKSDAIAVGTVQATIFEETDRPPVAELAWIIASQWQRQGFASQAASALVEWLAVRGVDEIVAHLHPGNLASAVVASRAGLHATDEHQDGETVWRNVDARVDGHRARNLHISTDDEKDLEH